MHDPLLHIIGLCIVAATVLAYVARMARQPLILAYIGAGILIGPVGLRWVREEDRATVEKLAELGLAFLLLIVGLEIDVKKLVSSGRSSAIATVVQVAGCALLAWLAAMGLGFRMLPAVYVGAAAAFSSTMIVVKLLSDRSELDTIAGRLTLAILLFQDVLAIVFLAIQPSLGGGEGSALATMALAVVKGLGLVAGSLVVSRYVLPPLFRSVAKSPEIVLISAISWCFIVSYFAIQAGFSVAMGALIAGVSMSTFPYSLDVVAKIRSLRDFFVTLFFVSLGMLLTVPDGRTIAATAVLSAVVILSRFLTVWPALRALRHDNRVGILSSIHLAQISEFALVIALLGVQYKHIDSGLVTVVVMTLVVTSTVSTYLIQGSHRIVKSLVRRASDTIFEDPHAEQTRVAKHAPAPIVLLGCFRVGSSLVHDLLDSGKKFSVIDFNPEVLAALRKLGVPCLYGDISHLDTLEHAGIEHAKVLICPIPDDFLRGTDSRKMLQKLRRLNPQAEIILTTESVQRAVELYEAGADYVLLPRIMAADRLIEIIDKAEAGALDDVREAHRGQLEERREVVS